jgi:predicted RNase H-like nuclease (RuvC/YqgF family)
MNKLSELSKPVQIFKHPTGRNFWAVMADSTAGQNGVEPFYSQEYVSSLLAELEAKDKRIADLEAGLLNSHHRLMNTTQNCSEWERKAISNFDKCANMSQRIEELEAKLATPVRLKKVDSSNVPFAGDGFNAAVDYCAKAVRSAGFTVEGDE